MSKTVELTKYSIAMLGVAESINQTLKVEAKNSEIHTKNEIGTIGAIIDLGIEMPESLCIYELKEFLSVLKLFEKPSIEFDGTTRIKIFDADNPGTYSKYVTADENLITSHFDDATSAKLDGLVSDVDVDVTLPSTAISDVISASAAMKLEYVGFIGDGETIKFSAFSKNDGSDGETSSYSSEVGETEDKFRLFYLTGEQFSKIPLGKDEDVSFKICKNMRSVVETANIKLHMALNNDSKYED